MPNERLTNVDAQAQAGIVRHMRHDLLADLLELKARIAALADVDTGAYLLQMADATEAMEIVLRTVAAERRPT